MPSSLDVHIAIPLTLGEHIHTPHQLSIEERVLQNPITRKINMNSGLLQVLVEEDYGYEKEGKNWGRAVEHSSLVVNEEAQKWYWNSEDMGGGVLDYLMKVRGLNKKAATEILDIRGKVLQGSFTEDVSLSSYRPYEKLVENLWELGKGNREYWHKRRLTDKTIDRYRLGFYDGWNLIPLYIGDTFVNFQCRRDEPEKRIKMWYKVPNWKPVLVNAEMLQLVDSVFITEGPVDAILLNQEGIPAVSHTGGSGYWGDDWFGHFSRVKKIYYITDNDDAGRGAARKVSKALGEDRTFIYLFEGKPEHYDTGDYFKEGGNAKDFKLMVEASSKNLCELGELHDKRKQRRTTNHRVSTAVY